MASKETILERIAALTKKAESLRKQGGENYEKEADAAAELASKLMFKYKLEQSEVESFMSREEIERNDPMGSNEVYPEDYGIRLGRKRLNWKNMVAEMVATNCSCVATTSSVNNNITFWGREQDRAVAVYLYTFLLREVLDRADIRTKLFRERGRMKFSFRGETYYQRPSEKEIMGVRGSFISGIVSGLGTQIRKNRQEAVNGSDNPERALKVLDDGITTATTYMHTKINVVEGEGGKMQDFFNKYVAEGYAESKDINIPGGLEGSVTRESLRLTGK